MNQDCGWLMIINNPMWESICLNISLQWITHYLNFSQVESLWIILFCIVLPHPDPDNFDSWKYRWIESSKLPDWLDYWSIGQHPQTIDQGRSIDTNKKAVLACVVLNVSKFATSQIRLTVHSCRLSGIDLLNGSHK